MISERYIKQCDCKEIQSQWKPKAGDRVAALDARNNNYDTGVIVEMYERGDRTGVPDTSMLFEVVMEGGVRLTLGDEDITYLPRTEDFQEILYQNHLMTYDIQIQGVAGFAKVYINKFYKNKEWVSDNIFNELWVAFYMYCCHNKEWDNEKGWVK